MDKNDSKSMIIEYNKKLIANVEQPGFGPYGINPNRKHRQVDLPLKQRVHKYLGRLAEWMKL